MWPYKDGMRQTSLRAKRYILILLSGQIMCNFGIPDALQLGSLSLLFEYAFVFLSKLLSQPQRSFLVRRIHELLQH